MLRLACTLHDLIIAKLEAHEFHVDVLKRIHDYLLSNRKQIVELIMHVARGRIYVMTYGVPKRSTRFFNIQHTLMRSILLFERLRYCKLCG